jgi:lysophospholipase L1-like esterase
VARYPLLKNSLLKVRRTVGALLAISLCANLALIGTGAYFIHRRGGVRYLWARLASGNLMDPVEGHRRYRQSLFEMFDSYRNPGGHPVVFVGDSMTEGCDWHEAFGDGLTIANRGIGGDTTIGVLRRIGEIVAMAPRAVFLMIGLNDCLMLRSKPSQAAKNYEAIVKGIRTGSPQTAIYLESILPVASFRGEGTNDWIREMNERIRALADGRMVVFVSLYEGFLEGTSLSMRFTDDGVHPNAAGYALWRQEVAPFVRSAIGDETW